MQPNNTVRHMSEDEPLFATPHGTHPSALIERLELIVARPDMFFCSPSKLECLDAYLAGYDAAAVHYRHDARLALGSGFSKWLIEKKKFKGGSNVLWTALFRMRYPVERDALTEFLPLFKEYLADFGSLPRPANRHSA